MHCKHAALAAIYAKQMAEMDEPWRLWEWKYTEFNWTPCKGHPSWLEDSEYRQTPKTININGHEVPEPMREKPEINSKYWIPSALSEDWVDWFSYIDNNFGNRLLDKGLCHATKEAAIAHAKALFSFTEIKEQI